MQELTQDNFDEITGSGKVVVDFWAPWCHPCRMFAPTFEETAGEIDDVAFAKVNTEDEPELAQKAGIRAIPTLVFYEDGKEVTRLSGALPKQQFKEKIDQVFS